MITSLNLYFSPIKMVKMFVISICILALGVYCLMSDIVIVKMIGLFEIILGLATLFIALKSAFNKSPQIIFDESGIIDNRILKNKIFWDEIQNLELLVLRNQKVMRIIIPNNFGDKNFKWLYRKSSKLSLNEKPKKVLLNLDHLNVDYDILNRFLRSKKTDYLHQNLDKQLTGLGSLINRVFY